MQRFYREDFFYEENMSINDKDLYHQLISVLRLRLGSQIIFFNGVEDKDAIYEIKEITKKEIFFEKKEEIQKNENKSYITYIQANLNKISKIEDLVQKATQTGVKHIIFFEAEFSQNIFISEKKKERIFNIAKEAIEQSGRNFLPKIEWLHLGEIDLQRENTKYYYSDIKNEKSIFLKDILKNKREKKCIFIGPEGGWSENEKKFFAHKNIKNIYFQTPILRSETVIPCLEFFARNI